MRKAENPRLGSSGFVGKAQTGKIVFKAVRDALNQEVVKVLGELEKQLTAILGDVDFKDSERQTQQTSKCLPDQTCKIKRDVKQLFIYLQRVLMINVTQDLCKRLTKAFDEPMKIIMQGNVERQRLESKIVDYEKRIGDLSEKAPEDEIRLDKCGEDQCGICGSLESLSERVRSLLELNRNVTDLLEYVSREFLDAREENRNLKGIRADSVA